MTFPKALAVSAAIVLSSWQTISAEPRSWSDTSGKFRVEADLVAVDEELVTLRKLDGRTIKVPIAKLSETDQKFLASQTTVEEKNPLAESEREQSKARAEGNADNPGGLSILVAEGTGTSPQEALKDAFREAVRQVVGSVVDAETLIKNDELIDDKVLTYSDGFITKYDKLDETQRGGLVRIKISAVVERRSLVQKLKAANVTVKEVDGSGLFSEAVTQLEAEQGVERLLRKALEGFPQSLITASVVGRPELVDKTDDNATVRVRILVEPDMEAYKAFVSRMQTLLEKVSKGKGDFTALFKPETVPTQDKSFIYFSPKEPGYIEVLSGWMPKAFSGSQHSPRLKPDYTAVALTTGRSKSADRLECQYFLLDNAARSLLADVAFRTGRGKLSLLDSDGEVVVVDRFAPFERETWNTGTYEGTLIASAGHIHGDMLYMLGRQDRDSDTSDRKKEAQFFWIAPVFIQPNTNRIHHKPSIHITRTVSLNLDELKSVQTAKCEIAFDE